jgi:hypothetical protein
MGATELRYSRPLTVTIVSLNSSTWTPYATHSGYRFKYPSNWVVDEAEEDRTVTISIPQHLKVISVEGSAAISISYEANPSNLSMSQYFNGQVGPDLYTGPSNTSSVIVASIPSIKFTGGLFAEPGTQMVVVPVSGAFILVATSVPDDILKAFLDTMSVP